MAITISGSTDTISAADGSLTIAGTQNVDQVTVGTGASVGSPATNVLTLGTNDVERLRIDPSGNIGVGTNSPASSLNFGDTAANSGIQFGDSADFTIKRNISDTTIDFNVGADINHFQWKVGGINYMRLDSSGRLGIGTDLPNYKLHLHSATAGDSNYLQITHSDAGGGSSDGLQLGLATGSSPDAYLAQKENADLIFQTNAANRARIDSSGRLLVGTNSARTNVDFYGTALTPHIQLEGTSNDTSTLSLIANSTTDNISGQLRFGKSGADGVGNNGAVVANEVLGRISFSGNDGTDFEIASEIISTAQSNASANNVSANLRFYTRGDGGSNREAMHINAGGFTKLKGNSDSVLSLTGDYHEVVTNRSNNDCLVNKSFDGSYTATNYMALAARSANSAYAFMYCVSGHTGSTDNEFRLMGDGNAYADGSWNGGGADYAEMFEWSDGNPDTEDRRGLSVVLDGDKIREAVSGEDPIGVISGNPSVIGDAAWNKWSGKNLTDDYGSYVFEEHNVVEWTDELGVHHSYEDWAIPEGVVVPDDAVVKTHDGKGNRLTHRAVNPAYDPDVAYVPREERPEWDAVGLMGKLRIRKGQVTGARWIKMRDISDNVEEWLVR